jgi:hypothetical protein
LKNTADADITTVPRFYSAEGASGHQIELAPVTLKAQESVEVDLRGLLAAAAARTDLETTSVQVDNTGAPGSLIGALYSTNNTTHLTYDVPLRDSGRMRNSTGSYP